MSTWANLASPNIGLLFNKHIYQEPLIAKKVIEEGGELRIKTAEKASEFDGFYNDMCNYDLSAFANENEVPFNTSIFLQAVYPGLLVGSGYTHDTKAEGDFKIGFYFDHTSGLPVVPGSSIKGVLRSIFEKDTDRKGFNYTGERSVSAVRFILDSIIANEIKLDGNRAELVREIKEGLTIEQLTNVKEIIFGGVSKKGSDIFFDSTLVIKDGKFIAKDFITPHKEALKNPVPLQFLKVLPGAIFQLSFFLTDQGWPKNIKSLIFKHTLLTNGFGAKTNVGYGQFTEIKQPLKNVSKKIVDKKEYVLPTTITFSNSLAKGSLLQAVITNIKSPTEFEVEVFLGIKSQGKHPVKTEDWILKKGQAVAVKIKSITNGKISSINIFAE